MTVNCPKCGHEEQEGILLCSHCGAFLTKIDGIHTAPVHKLRAEGRSTEQLEVSESLLEEQPKDAILSFHILHTGHILPFLGKGQFIIGRVSEGQSILPDLDLEPYKAYEAGVSRIHAKIRIAENAAFITDLGSSNGTKLNGKNILPHQEQTIHHEDVIQLGKLSIQALVRETL